MGAWMAILFRPQIDILDLPCERLPRGFDGLGVLHLSDLHVTKWTKKLDVWREELGKLKPDVVVITGDLGHRSWLWKMSLENVQRLLEPLRPKLGTYFILGNHDSAKRGPARAEPRDRAGGQRVMLRNETVFVVGEKSEVRIQESEEAGEGERIALIGVHQHRRIDTDIPAAMRSVRAADFKLMLLHYPDLVHPAIAAGVDICLCGAHAWGAGVLAGWFAAVRTGYAFAGAVHGGASDQWDVDDCEPGDWCGGGEGAVFLSAAGGDVYVAGGGEDDDVNMKS